MNFYFITSVCLILEIVIMSCAPWLFWMTDAPFRAGQTFISEYSIILLLRFLIILIFQRRLLSSIIHLIVGFFKRLLLSIRLLSTFSTDEQENIDTQVNQIEQVRRGVGRPRKY